MSGTNSRSWTNDSLVQEITQILITVNTREEALLAVALVIPEAIGLRSFSAIIPTIHKQESSNCYELFHLNLETLSKSVAQLKESVIISLKAVDATINFSTLDLGFTNDNLVNNKHSLLVPNYSNISKYMFLVFEPNFDNASFTTQEIALFEIVSNQLVLVFDRINYMKNLAESALEVKSLHKELERKHTELEDKYKQKLVELEKVRAEKLLNQRVRAEKVASTSKAFQEYNHEIRTPLTVLKGEIGIFDPQIDSLEEFQKECNEQIKRMEKIIDATLAIDPSTEMGKMTLINLNDIINEMLPFYENKIITVKQSTGDLDLLLGNKTELRLLLDNLVKNALDILNCSEDGEICIKTWQEINKVFLSVRDNGPGISREILSKVESGLGSSHLNSNSRGLGLSKVYSIVAMHSGRIMVETEPGKGTEFIVEFPVATEDSDLL
jgi:signal transduction histidine kinase